MNLKDYRAIQKKRMLTAVRYTGIAGLVLISLFTISARLTGRPAAAAEDNQTQTVRQLQVQDMQVMLQNAAVWTDRGLVVLQGNRLLHYSADMQLRQTVALPVGTESTAKSKAVPQKSSKPVYTAPQSIPALRSSVAAQIIAAEDGLIVVRGQQVIRLDSNFKVTGQAALPDLPQLTPAEQAAIFPNGNLLLDGGLQLTGLYHERTIETQR